MLRFFQQNTKHALNNKNDVINDRRIFSAYQSVNGMGVYEVLGRVCYQLYKNVCGYLHSFMLREKKQGNFPEKARVSESSGGQNIDEWV